MNVRRVGARRPGAHRQQAPVRTATPAAQTPTTVALLYHSSDADQAGQLASLLSAAGISVVPPTVEADGVVVFLSATGLAQPGWLSRASLAVRLVPVRVGSIRADLVPDQRLRELNWIDWQPDNVQATFGYVLAGLLSDPVRRSMSRQLSHETDAWLRSGRSDALVITDYRRARQLAAVLIDLKADQLAAPTPAMHQFVERSVRVSRPKYRLRRIRAVLGAAGTVLALITVAVAVPAIRLGTYNNKESIVTTGDPYMLQDLPEWSAANAAALLVNGTPAEQSLARVTLLRALSSPWEIDALQWTHGPYSSVPFDQGTRAILSVGTELAEIDVKTQQALWTGTTSGGPYYLAVDPQGRTAVGLSQHGAIVINLPRHNWRTVASGTQFVDGRLGSDGIAVVRITGARLAELNTATGAVTFLGTYPALISVAARSSRGDAAALVRDQAGGIDLIQLPSRTVIASTPSNSSEESGAIAPDGTHAIVTGGDGQFWTFGVGEPATPTGIPVPSVLSGFFWAAGDRLLVYSEDQRGQVYYLPRAELLGAVCWQTTRLFEVVPDYTSDVVACEGQGNTSFWDLPSGPLRHPVPGESGEAARTDDGLTITSSGTQLEIRGPGLNVSGYQSLDSDISAVDVAEGGMLVVVGDTIGQVAVIDLERGYVATVVVWSAPDNSPIAAVGWDSGPIATTQSGETWRLTDCVDCGTDAGLLRAYRARVTGCFSARQLASIGQGTWPVLGLRECYSAIGEPAQLGGN